MRFQILILQSNGILLKMQSKKINILGNIHGF